MVKVSDMITLGVRVVAKRTAKRKDETELLGAAAKKKKSTLP